LRPGNDSPFAPIYPSTDGGVPQRAQDIRKAKELMEAAGLPSGFEGRLTTERYADIPDYAVLFQNFAKLIGVRVELNIETQGTYYGKAVFGQSDWLDSPLGITDYAHRGVPNVFLQAPLLSDGPWSAAHFKNATYDGLVAQYVKALDIGAQKSRRRDREASARRDTGDHQLFPRSLGPDAQGPHGPSTDSRRPAA
jgi:peptide/nickel transport system substrate-binding protein